MLQNPHVLQANTDDKTRPVYISGLLLGQMRCKPFEKFLKRAPLGTWLAGSVEPLTLAFGALSSHAMLDVEITLFFLQFLFLFLFLEITLNK